MAGDKKAEQRSAQNLFLKMYAEMLGLSADSIGTALQDIIQRVMKHRKVMLSILETLDSDQQEAGWVLLGDHLPPRPVEAVNVEGLILDQTATDAFRVEELDVDNLDNNNPQEQDNTTVTASEPIVETSPEPIVETSPEPTPEPTVVVDDNVYTQDDTASDGEDPPQIMTAPEATQEADNDVSTTPPEPVEVQEEEPAQDTVSQAAVASTDAIVAAPKKRGGPRGPRAPKVVVDGDAFDGDLVAVTLDGTRTAAKSLRTAILILFRKVVDENKLDETRASWFKKLDEAVTDERLYRKLEGTDIKVFLNLAVPDCKKRVQALLNILKCDITLHFAEGDRTVSGVSE